MKNPLVLYFVFSFLCVLMENFFLRTRDKIKLRLMSFS